jgi:shikimate dehydrogenase
MIHLGIIGYPLAHSLSPRLHTAALQELKLEGDYQLFPIPPFPEGTQSFQGFFNKIRNGELHGLNVTIPYKQSVIPFLDELTPVARAIGAVNTIFHRQNSLVGDNTDAPGFSADLERFLLSEENKKLEEWSHNPLRALVLGAGGSARAVVYALDKSGWKVTIAARRREQAEELINTMKFIGAFNQKIAVVNLNTSSINNVGSEIQLVVNTTPLGMTPNVEASPWPSESAFPKRAFVYDLVYNPPETALIRTAKMAGLSTTNGLGMLIEQAALSFEQWTGQPATRQAMREAVAEI